MSDILDKPQKGAHAMKFLIFSRKIVMIHAKISQTSSHVIRSSHTNPDT